MGLLSLLFAFTIVYALFNILLGVGWGAYYLFKEQKIVAISEFMYVLFFPAYGLGAWLYDRKVRRNIPTKFNKQWSIFRKMLLVNWLFIAVLAGLEWLFFVSIYLIHHYYSHFTHEVSSTLGKDISGVIFCSFGWMIDLSVTIALIATVLLFLFSFFFCFMLLIVFPKVKIRAIEKAYSQ